MFGKLNVKFIDIKDIYLLIRFNMVDGDKVNIFI